MYRTVYDLTRAELDELKESYYYQLMDNDEEVVFPLEHIDYIDVATPSDIPDDVIFEHYSGINFTVDDFFCNAIEAHYSIKIKRTCISCCEEIESDIYKDNLGWFCLCPKCGASFNTELTHKELHDVRLVFDGQ